MQLDKQHRLHIYFPYFLMENVINDMFYDNVFFDKNGYLYTE